MVRSSPWHTKSSVLLRVGRADADGNIWLVVPGPTFGVALVVLGLVAMIGRGRP
jgi:hypothetical protein